MEIVVEFKYPGPYSNLPGMGEKAEVRCFAASRLVTYIIGKKLGLTVYNEYMWPDGSLYKAVVVPKNETAEGLFQRLKSTFTGRVTCKSFQKSQRVRG